MDIYTPKRILPGNNNKKNTYKNIKNECFNNESISFESKKQTNNNSNKARFLKKIIELAYERLKLFFEFEDTHN